MAVQMSIKYRYVTLFQIYLSNPLISIFIKHHPLSKKDFGKMNRLVLIFFIFRFLYEWDTNLFAFLTN